MRSRLPAGLVAAMLLLALATPVSAEAPEAQGWWWSATPAGAQQQLAQPVVSPQPVQGGDNRTQVVAFIGIIVLAVIYLRLAETQGRAPRSLVAFGRRAQDAGEPAKNPKPAAGLPAADPTPGKRIGGLRSARNDEE